MKEIPITIEFDYNRPAGFASITDEAKKIFEDMKSGGTDYVMAPTFLVGSVDDDGVIHDAELIALSLIPAARAVKKDSA